MKVDGIYEFEIVPPGDGNPHWTVQLPHQCDEFEIVGWSALGYPAEPTSAADSVAQMEVFIAEAQAALETLRVLAMHNPGCQMLTTPPAGFPFGSFSCNCDSPLVRPEEDGDDVEGTD